MTYIVIKVYSFECDRQGCGEVSDDVICPPPGPGTLREALRELEKQHRWFLHAGKQYCPKHKP